MQIMSNRGSVHDEHYRLHFVQRENFELNFLQFVDQQSFSWESTEVRPKRLQ